MQIAPFERHAWLAGCYEQECQIFAGHRQDQRDYFLAFKASGSALFRTIPKLYCTVLHTALPNLHLCTPSAFQSEVSSTTQAGTPRTGLQTLLELHIYKSTVRLVVASYQLRVRLSKASDSNLDGQSMSTNSCQILAAYIREDNLSKQQSFSATRTSTSTRMGTEAGLHVFKK